MLEKRACGFVVYRVEGGEFLYLTLKNARHGDYGAPKGHVGRGEGELETALRETVEETGLAPPRLVPNARFRRQIRYLSHKDLRKTAVYYLARADSAEVHLSEEHDEAAWRDLDETLGILRHENLREVFRDAATYAKDPALQRGLSPEQARDLLEREAGTGAPLLDHSAQVAEMARALATARGDVDADYVEAAAWLHDIGRTRTHGRRHPIEGFRLLVSLGHPGYAPPCLSHYLKGASPEELQLDEGDAQEMWSACDLESFTVEERLVALADAMAKGSHRTPIEERYDELVRRHGASRFLDHARAAALELKAEFEAGTGRDLYEYVGIG